MSPFGGTPPSLALEMQLATGITTWDTFPRTLRGREEWEAAALLVGAAQQWEENTGCETLQANTSPIR